MFGRSFRWLEKKALNAQKNLTPMEQERKNTPKRKFRPLPEKAERTLELNAVMRRSKSIPKAKITLPELPPFKEDVND